MILKQLTVPESKEVLKSRYTKKTISDKSPVHDFPIIYGGTPPLESET